MASIHQIANRAGHNPGYNWDIIIKTVSSSDTLDEFIDMELGPNGPIETANAQITYVGDMANVLDRVVDLIP